MQNSTNTSPKTSTADVIATPHDADLTLSAPIELDAESLRHVGGGAEETPVVSW